jgi:hypothetical protein
LSVHVFGGAGQGRTARHARGPGPSAHPAPRPCRPRNRPKARPRSSAGFLQAQPPNRSPAACPREYAAFGRPSVGLGCRLAARRAISQGRRPQGPLRASDTAANTCRAATAESDFHTHDRRGHSGITSGQAHRGRWPDGPPQRGTIGSSDQACGMAKWP